MTSRNGWFFPLIAILSNHASITTQASTIEEIMATIMAEETVPIRSRPTLKTRPIRSGVSLSAYKLDEDQGLVFCEVEEALQQQHKTDDDKARGKTTSYWLDAQVEMIEQNMAGLREKVFQRLSLSSFLKRHLTIKQLQSPQMLALAQSALLVIRILPPIGNSENKDELSSSSASMRHHTAAICLRNKLITVTFSQDHTSMMDKATVDLMGGEDIFSALMEQETLPHFSVSGAVVAWLHHYLNHTAAETNRLRTEIFKLTEQEDNVALCEIVRVRDRLLQITAVAEEQNEFMQCLANGAELTAALDFTPPSLKGYLAVLVATAGSTERMAIRLEKRVDDLRSSYAAKQQDRINQRLAVLTILSAIFLPLTLMAGIWGMNFINMPVLERENGYYFALMAMALLGLLLLFGFYYFGWLS
jgi:Mg2+ and Co2+ transporter CorA